MAPPYRIPLAFNSIGEEEKQAISDVLRAGRYTQGEQVDRFEETFARYIGVRHGVMVNSGSSANLLAITALRYLGLFDGHADVPLLSAGDEVIIQAQCWPTTLTPILNAGAKPVFCDVSPDTLNATAETVDRVRTKATRAVVGVPILGNPSDIVELRDYCRQNKLIFVEDACESLGAVGPDGRMIGSYGLLSSFSFYFSHHITTVEGGCIATDSPVIAALCRSLRDHGWVRKLRGVSLPPVLPRFAETDDRYCFFLPGYNVRPTEFSAVLGLAQMEKLPDSLVRRRGIAAARIAALSKFARFARVPGAQTVDRHSWMAFSVIFSDARIKQAVQEDLEKNGIETRPVVVGNILNHPISHFLGQGPHTDLRGCDEAFRRGLMLGLSPFTTEADEDYFQEKLTRAIQAATAGA